MRIEVEVDEWDLFESIDDSSLLDEAKKRGLKGYDDTNIIEACNRIVDLHKMGRKDLAESELSYFLYEVTGRNV